MKSGLIGLISLSVLAMPGLALADGSGVAAGAVTGAVTGGLVGGPVGAAVGAGVGGVAGGVASGPDHPDTVYVAPGSGPAAGPGNGGCASRTVKTENGYGDSKTVTHESCD